MRVRLVVVPFLFLLCVSHGLGNGAVSEPLLVPTVTPPGFSVTLLSGETYQWHPAGQGVQRPVISYSYHPSSGLAQHQWTSDDSIDAFLTGASPHVDYVFSSYHGSVDTKWMKQRIVDRVQAHPSDPYRPSIHLNRRVIVDGKPVDIDFAEAREAFHDEPLRLYFVSQAVPSMTNWIPSLLSNWTTSVNSLTLGSERGGVTSIPRLDGMYGVIPFPAENATAEVTVVDSPCETFTVNVTGKAVLVPDVQAEGGKTCSYISMLQNLQNAGAANAIVQSNTDVLTVINCEGEECNVAINIPATMVPNEGGDLIRKAVTEGGTTAPTTVLATENWNGVYFGIDEQSELIECGWEKYPDLRILSWQSQWEDYKHNLNRNLSIPALEIKVFDRAVMQGNDGAAANVTLPHPRAMSEFDSVELDMALSCPGVMDEQCAIWDHTIQLYACCYHDGEPGPLCGQEIGRWISPFRRRIGRWLTPIKQYLPVFSSQQCTFTMKTAPWAMPWVPSLNLRFLHHQEDAWEQDKLERVSTEDDDKLEGSDVSTEDGESDPHFVPGQFIPLFRGGTFNQSYNEQYQPVHFTLPESAGLDEVPVRVELVAVITGHGSDNNDCGEFCVTSHVFTVDRDFVHNVTFWGAGDAWGSAYMVREGVIPNEHGTWVYGRDGWCDGMNVKPIVIDITSEVLAKEREARSNCKGISCEVKHEVMYQGYFQGETPNPTENPGYIIMYSHVLVSTPSGHVSQNMVLQ